MTKGHGRVVQALLELRSRLSHDRPEAHYMRGPGPKTLLKLGETLRAETEDVLREPIPDWWLALIHSIEERKRDDGEIDDRFRQNLVYPISNR